MIKPHTQTVDISQITKYIFLGADLCCGIDHYQRLYDQGIYHDIDLQEEREVKPAPGLKSFLWLPVKDDTAPSPAQLLIGTRHIEAAVKNQEKVFIHCRLGHGRSPTLVAAYFILGGTSAKEALAKVKAKRPEIHPVAEQMQALEAFARARPWQ